MARESVWALGFWLWIFAGAIGAILTLSVVVGLSRPDFLWEWLTGTYFGIPAFFGLLWAFSVVYTPAYFIIFVIYAPEFSSDSTTTSSIASAGGGSQSDERSTSTGGSPGHASQSDTEPPTNRGTPTQAHYRGDNYRDEAEHYRDAEEYDQALETYDKARAAYKEALDTAKYSDRLDTDEIEMKVSEINKQQQEVQQKRLREKVESLRSTLERAEKLTDDRKFENAQTVLEELESPLDSAKDSATQHGFSDLLDEITSLEQQRENRLDEVIERLKTRQIPDKIPQAPDISVDYDALTGRELIGKGGNADVTKATLSTSDGDLTLAIKEPRTSGTLRTDAVERMLQEAETWDKLDDHDHIVGVLDYGSEPIPWIAMEYMDAGHLGERAGELEIAQAVWTAIAVTKGVRHAHRRGVAHLDLKPENVLFRTVEDAWDVPKVADWGLSKHLLEQSRSIEGLTPEYAAPEQFDDEYGAADDITDIYQLGTLFYELFTGQPPFEGDPAKAMQQVLNERPAPPSERADLPDGLDEVLLTALAKEKEDRYEDTLLLRDALQDLFDECR